MTPATIGLIGLGNLGNPVALNLVEAGYPLLIHSLARAEAANLLARGATWADSVAEIGARSDVLITILPGPAQVRAVMIGEGGALFREPFGDAALPGERVTSARLGIAPRERLIRRVEEQHLDRVACAARVFDGARSVFQELPFPHVDHEREVVFRFTQLGDLEQQGRGQVVDAEPPRIFERANGRRLARARHAGDDQNALHVHSTSSSS